MSEKVTLTSEELQEFQGIRNEIFGTIGILGDLTYKKTLLEFEIESLNATIKQNVIKERVLLEQFGQKYGNGSINTETGEITPL
jgi:hypothetical protein